MTKAEWHQMISRWQLPEDGALEDRIERMIRPALLAGHFGMSYARLVAGLQHHHGGRAETAELAKLANICQHDHVLDAACFIGGTAIQLAETFKCRVTGIDTAPNCIAAANRIAELSGLAHLATFRVADAGNLPFDDGTFSVVWNQSLEHYDAWIREFDRVLAVNGRLAIKFEIGDRDLKEGDERWPLEDVVRFVESLGYCAERAEDTTQRDIEIGWKVLERRLSEREQEFKWLFGADWVKRAHEEFETAIAEMRRGEWGTGRIVARKVRGLDVAPARQL